LSIELLKIGYRRAPCQIGADGYDAEVAEATALEGLLKAAFPDAVELGVEDRTGGGDHFQVDLATPQFNGLSRLDQHKLVYDALAAPMRDGSIHELRIRTRGTE
jgi:stress-induced morphogen